MFPVAPQQPIEDEPAHFIYGHPQKEFQKGVHYNVNGYMYRYIGMRNDELGQSLPFLELVSSQRVAPGVVGQRQYAPKFVITPHEPAPGEQMSSAFIDSLFASPHTHTVPVQYLDPSAIVGQPVDQTLTAPQPFVQPLDNVVVLEQPTGQHWDQSFVFQDRVEQPVVRETQPGTSTEGTPSQPSDIKVEYEKTWNIHDYMILNIVEINVPESRLPENCHDLALLLKSCDLSQVMEIHRKQPVVFICEVKRQIDPVGQHFAVVYDRTEKGMKFAARPIEINHYLSIRKVLCVDQKGDVTPKNSFDFSGKGQGIRVRALLVGIGGWLVYFAPGRPWILTEGQYLVFTSPKSQVLFRRVLDTKRMDGKEIFIKQTMLSAEPPVDGMIISTAIVQRDTTNDGIFVIMGNGNSMISMTQIQNMVQSGQAFGLNTKNYFDKEPSTPKGISRRSTQAPGPSTGAIPKRR